MLCWCIILALVPWAGAHVATLAAPPERDVRPLDRAIAEQVFVQVERWVEGGAVPDQPAAIQATDAAAVHVAIRLSGLTLGQAHAMCDAPGRAAARPVDLAALARDATAQALRQARRSLVRLATRNPDANITADLAKVGPLLQVDCQVAHAPRPVKMQRLDQLPRRIVIGVHGLAMRRGERWAWVFPGQAIAANLSLQQQLHTLLSDVGLDAAAIARINADAGPTLHAMQVIHLIRPADADAVHRLHRGQRVLPMTPPDFTRIDRLASRWADYLLARQDDRGRFAGTFQPTSSQYAPRVAEARDAALAAYALARYAGAAHLPEARAGRYAAAARRAIDAALDEIDLDGEDGPPAIGDMAMALIALLETPDAADLKPQRDQLAARLTEAHERRGREPADANTTPRATPVDALSALAMVRYCDRTRSNQAQRTARQAMGSIWASVRAGNASQVMPWAGLAEFDLLRLDMATGGFMLVRSAAQQYWTRQVQPPGPAAAQDPADPSYVSPDTVGGFIQDATVMPEPTWRSADLLILQSAALGVPGLVEAEQRGTWLLNCALGLRFFEQLTLTRDAAWYVHDLGRGLGGVRTAFWDNRQPLATTAMALLAAAEYQLSLQRLAESAGD